MEFVSSAYHQHDPKSEELIDAGDLLISRYFIQLFFCSYGHASKTSIVCEKERTCTSMGLYGDELHHMIGGEELFEPNEKQV